MPVWGVGSGVSQDLRGWCSKELLPSADSQVRQVPGSHMDSSGYPQTFLAEAVR